MLAWLSLSAAAASGQEISAQNEAVAPAEQKAPAKLTDPPLDGQFDTLPYDDFLKRDSAAIFKILSEGDILPNQEAQFDNYFIKYSIGRWTWTEKSQVTNTQLSSLPKNNWHLLPKFRGELRSQLGTTFSKGPGVHSHLNALLVQQMEKIATGNYAPVVRINAALMLGELNSKESAKPNETVPLAAALEPLIRVMNSAQQLESVKVAALQGLYRRAETGIPAGNTRTALQKSLLELISTDTPPDRLSTGYDWMRGQAADILGAIGDPGDQGEIALALGQLVSNAKSPQASPGTRRAAARALGRLDYTKAPGLDVTPLATALTQLAIGACQYAMEAVDADDALAVDVIRPAVAKSMDTRLSVAKPTDVKPPNTKVVDTNRQLRSMIQAVKIGFTGLDGGRRKGVASAAKTDVQKKLISSASEQVAILMSALDFPKAADVDKEKVVAAVNTALAGLKPLIEK